METSGVPHTAAGQQLQGWGRKYGHYNLLLALDRSYAFGQTLHLAPSNLHWQQSSTLKCMSQLVSHQSSLWHPPSFISDVTCKCIKVLRLKFLKKGCRYTNKILGMQ